jgi:hypothetical protein
MLTTSVSLPATEAEIWRHSQREVMQMAIRTLRLTMFKNGLRRGVKRSYNQRQQNFKIVTTRFTGAEYDTLHCAAAAMRVSVSWLVYRMILLWLKPARRIRGNTHVTNYECDSLRWSQNVGVVTECLFFWPKIRSSPSPKRIARQIPDKSIHFT